jgi:phosphoribosyl-ATP pyrophosphohydrolase/phosphoribosyl-AMP cyclohydrolase
MKDVLIQQLRFDDRGLLPVVIQDLKHGRVLMVGYMNLEALMKTLETGRVHFWSRSRNALWCKGETSGHLQHLEEIRLDCDGDTLLVKVKQEVAACHTGHRSCFFRVLTPNGWKETEERVFDPEDVYGKKR